MRAILEWEPFCTDPDGTRAGSLYKLTQLDDQIGPRGLNKSHVNSPGWESRVTRAIEVRYQQLYWQLYNR